LPDYLAQSRRVTDEQLALLRYGIGRFRGGVYFQHFLGIDQNSHMLWAKHEDELLTTYRLFDEAVGWVRKNAGDATLIVMSDHGFAPFDRAVHLNTWLLREGFLTLDDPSNIDRGELFPHVNWSKTQAYALGLNGLYLNLRGRERHGIVEPGALAGEVQREIARRLLKLRDGEASRKVVAQVYSPREIFHGDALGMAPDLIIGYAPPYRSSWQSALGAIPSPTIEDNNDAWIGDHCIAAEYVPGVLIANRRVRLKDPQLADLTVTILSQFGVWRPQEMRGRLVF
jgi:predicted AlkP superfamily phosphohydrolase/phosphomutase